MKIDLTHLTKKVEQKQFERFCQIVIQVLNAMFEDDTDNKWYFHSAFEEYFLSKKGIIDEFSEMSCNRSLVVFYYGEEKQNKNECWFQKKTFFDMNAIYSSFSDDKSKVENYRFTSKLTYNYIKKWDFVFISQINHTMNFEDNQAYKLACKIIGDYHEAGV